MPRGDSRSACATSEGGRLCLNACRVPGIFSSSPPTTVRTPPLSISPLSGRTNGKHRKVITSAQSQDLVSGARTSAEATCADNSSCCLSPMAVLKTNLGLPPYSQATFRLFSSSRSPWFGVSSNCTQLRLAGEGGLVVLREIDLVLLLLIAILSCRDFVFY